MSEKLIRASRPVSILLLIAYPFAVHAGIVTGVIWPAIALIGVLLLWQTPLLTTNRWIWAVLPIIGLLLWFMPQWQNTVLYAPPLLVILLLLGLFGRSLLPGHEPLVSRIARIMHDAPSIELLRYTRAVTVGWVVFLALMLLEVIGLTLFATPEQWSLFTNFYNYFFMGIFFLLEFALRRFFIDPTERISLPHFFHRLVTIDYRKLFRQQ